MPGAGALAVPVSIPPPPAVPASMPPPAIDGESELVESESDYPVAETPFVTRPLLQRVLQVLLLAPVEEQDALLALMHGDNLRVTCLSSVADVIHNVKLDAPDLVLADEQLAQAGGLVAALRTDAAADASTDYVPIVFFESAAGSSPLDDDLDAAFDLLNLTPDAPDGRVPRPLEAEALVRTIGRATGTLVEAVEPAPIGAVTIDELVDRFASELRRGLVDTVLRGRSERLDLGDGSDVLASAYGAVATVRASVQRASAGRVEFEIRGRNGGPSLVMPRAEIDFARDDEFGRDEPSDGLHGRRVILAEADTAIALLLANLLREHGCSVVEFTDGRAALDAARKERSSLIITGARLPGIDGFALSRALARDPLLADVPVLLLPSKSELLSPNKELAREAAQQVLHSASQLLAPRHNLEARLKEPGELRGNLEGMGVMSVLRSVRRARPDARVRIRDAWNLYECELRDGKVAQVTRTASDGSFVRNERAIPHLLGVSAGRFAVVEDHTPVKIALEGTLDEVLLRGARELSSELDAVSARVLPRIARVVFDEDAYALLIGQTPPLIRGVLEQLYAGAVPSQLIAQGAVDPETLDALLFDLARRGALRGVIGSEGEDLVAEARAARKVSYPSDQPSPLMSVVPPPPNPVISVLPDPDAAQPLADVPGVLEVRAPEPTPVPPAAPSPEPPKAQEREARVREANLSDASELAAAAAEARRSRSTLAAWTVALLGLAAVALFAGREAEESGAMPEALGGAPTPLPSKVGPPGPRLQGGSLISAEDNGFAVYDGILDPNAATPEQALLVVEATPSLADAIVVVNDRELGAPPQKLALPEGVHELAIKRGDAISYRFVSVHPGRTWVLRNP
ncbi:MAG: response regulator [Polyangiales bacterium]